jgi:hypothetical protein
MHFFEGPDLLVANDALDELVEAFNKVVPDGKDPKLPVHCDSILETKWVLKRRDLPDWTIIWSIAARAKCRAMSREDAKDTIGPPAVYESVRIKPGTIVYIKQDYNNTLKTQAYETFLKAR